MAANAKVIDASFALCFLLSEGNYAVDQTFIDYKKGSLALISTHLLSFEVLNALKTAVTRKKIDKKTALELAKNFVALKIEPVEVENEDCLKLAFSENLTFYDASYLCLSQKLKLPILSLDSHLGKFAS